MLVPLGTCLSQWDTVFSRCSTWGLVLCLLLCSAVLSWWELAVSQCQELGMARGCRACLPVAEVVLLGIACIHRKAVSAKKTRSNLVRETRIPPLTRACEDSAAQVWLEMLKA